MNTDVSICNQALIKLGGLPITSLDEQRLEAIVAKLLYQSAYASLLSAYPWSFALKKRELDPGIFDPVKSVYRISLPADFLRIVRVGYRDSSAIVQYQMESGDLLVGSDRVSLTYVSLVSEDSLPQYFVQALVAKLAAEFCLPVTESSSRAELLFRLASQQEAVARNNDGQQTQPSSISDFPLIEVRD